MNLGLPGDGLLLPTSRYGSRMNSAASSISATRTKSESSSTGFRRTSRRTPTRSDASTAPPAIEHADPRQGEHPQWGTYTSPARKFQLPHRERGALLAPRDSTATVCAWTPWRACSTWITARGPGAWVPNKGRRDINYDTIEFLKHLNSIMGRLAPHAILIAEESTSFPCITRPPEQGRPRLPLQRWKWAG